MVYALVFRKAAINILAQAITARNKRKRVEKREETEVQCQRWYLVLRPALVRKLKTERARRGVAAGGRGVETRRRARRSDKSFKKARTTSRRATRRARERAKRRRMDRRGSGPRERRAWYKRERERERERARVRAWGRESETERGGAQRIKDYRYM